MNSTLFNQFTLTRREHHEQCHEINNNNNNVDNNNQEVNDVLLVTPYSSLSSLHYRNNSSDHSMLSSSSSSSSSSLLLQQALLTPSVSLENEHDTTATATATTTINTTNNNRNSHEHNTSSFTETSFTWKALFPWIFNITSNEGENDGINNQQLLMNSSHQQQEQHQQQNGISNNRRSQRRISIHRRQLVNPHRSLLLLNNYNYDYNDSIDEGNEQEDDEDDVEDIDNNQNNDVPIVSQCIDCCDPVLQQCYFFSFLFTPKKYHPTIISYDQQRQQNKTSLCNRMTTIIVLGIILLVLWCVGIYSFLNIQEYVAVTNDENIFSLLRTTGSNTMNHNNGSIISSSERAHDAFENAYYNHNNRNNNNHFVNTYPSTPLILIIRHNINVPNTTLVKSTTMLTEQQSFMYKPHNTIDRTTLFYQQGRDYVHGLESFLMMKMNDSNDTNVDSSNKIRITSYYSYIDSGLYWYAHSSMATPDGSSVLVHINYDSVAITTTNTTSAKNNTTSKSKTTAAGLVPWKTNIFRRTLMNAIDEYTDQYYLQYINHTSSKSPLCITIDRTGIPYMEVGFTKMIQHHIRTVVLLVVPIVLLVLSGMIWYMYNANLFMIWIVPSITICTTLSLQTIIVWYAWIPYYSGSFYLVTFLFMIIISLVESIIQTIVLLTRFMEEMKSNGKDGTTTIIRDTCNAIHVRKSIVIFQSLHRMLQSSGSTIISATFTSFILLLIITVITSTILVQSILIGICISIITTTIIHLLIVPLVFQHTPLGSLVVNPTKGSLPPLNDSGGQSHDLQVEQQLENDESDALEPQLNERQQPCHNYYENEYVDHFTNDNLVAESFSAQLLPTPRKSVWFCIARKYVHPYYGIIILLLILQLLGPIAHSAKRIKLSYQLLDLLSSNDGSLETYNNLTRQLGSGRLHPFRLLFDGRSANISMESKVGFAAMHLVLIEMQSIGWLYSTDLLDNHASLEMNIGDTDASFVGLYKNSSLQKRRDLYVPQMKYNMFNGIASVQNTFVSYDMFLTAKYCAPSSYSKKICPFEFFRMISATNEAVTSNDSFATYIQVEIGVDPFSRSGSEWLERARNAIDRLYQENRLFGIEVSIDGLSGSIYDNAHSTYQPFHKVMAIYIIALIVVLYTALFRSVTVSIRIILSTSLTALVSIGLTTLVYQQGILNWTKIASITAHAKDDGISWLFPILSLPIIIGLAVHFDCFITSRILEFRMRGYEHKSSLALSLDSVGNIITLEASLVAIVVSTPLLISQSRFYINGRFSLQRQLLSILL